PLQWRIAGSNCALRGVRVLDDQGDTVTLQDTLDLNGDGVPDFVDASTVPWTVYPGQVTDGGTGGGFGTAVTWNAAAAYLRVTFGNASLDIREGSWGAHFDNGTSDGQDLLDLNGDGLPDVVQPPPFGVSGPWTVWLNTGSGFESGSGTQF